jgi:hypothetical protein
LIGGDGDAAPFVSMRDEFEQDAGLGLILADRRKVVEPNKAATAEKLSPPRIARAGSQPLHASRKR